MAAEPLCQDLRGLVHDCLAKHLYESAAFYADKLVTLSDGTPGDVYVLAQVRASAALATGVKPSYNDGLDRVLLDACSSSSEAHKYSGLPLC